VTLGPPGVPPPGPKVFRARSRKPFWWAPGSVPGFLQIGAFVWGGLFLARFFFVLFWVFKKGIGVSVGVWVFFGPIREYKGKRVCA